MATVYCGTLESRWELSEAEEIVVRESNSARDKNYFYDPRYKAGYWNGYVDLFKGGRLPAGLVPDTVKALEAAGHPVSLVTHPLLDPPLRENAKLTYSLDPDHQLRILESMCETERGVVFAATNAGKTKIAQAWCSIFKLKTIYLVPSKELLTQTVASFERDTNLDVGWISADEGWNVGKDVTICLVSSVVPRRKRGSWKLMNQKVVDRFVEIAGDFEAVIADECHHSTSRSWTWILQKLKKARFRFGLSGSPWNEDDKLAELQVKAYLGPVIAKVQNAELIERGWSAKPKIRIVEIHSQVMDKDTDFLEVYDSGVVRNVPRNSMIARIAKKIAEQSKSCLIVTTRLDHTSILSEMLDALGVENRIVTGDMPAGERKAALEDFKASTFPILISTVMGEGVDIPHLQGIIIAAAGKSQKQLLQRVGRGVRKKVQGPNEVEIFDFMDHNHPALRRQSRERLDIYKSQGFEVEISKAIPTA